MWEQWKTLRSRLGSPQHTHSLILAVLWPLAILIVAVLAMRYVTTAKDLADLISATASLLWPIIAITVITWFRPELRALLARIRKGKILGQEFELDQMLDNTNGAMR
jgi:small-conductance mechanosensitive channel